MTEVDEMTLTFKYGKGKGDSYSSKFAIGGLVAELTSKHKDATLKQIADALAKKFKIQDGEIELDNIAFANYKRSK